MDFLFWVLYAVSLLGVAACTCNAILTKNLFVTWLIGSFLLGTTITLCHIWKPYEAFTSFGVMISIFAFFGFIGFVVGYLYSHRN